MRGGAPQLITIFEQISDKRKEVQNRIICPVVVLSAVMDRTEETHNTAATSINTWDFRHVQRTSMYSQRLYRTDYHTIWARGNKKVCPILNHRR
jgi:hypothetical protein